MSEELLMRQDVQVLNRRFLRKGLRVVPLQYCGQKAVLYVYRPAKLAQDICQI